MENSTMVDNVQRKSPKLDHRDSDVEVVIMPEGLQQQENHHIETKVEEMQERDSIALP